MKTPKTPVPSEKKSIKTALGGIIQKKKANGLTPKNTPKNVKTIPDPKGALELCNLKPGDGPKSPTKKGMAKKSKSCPTSPEVELGLKLEALLEKTYSSNKSSKLSNKDKRKSLNPSLLVKHKESTPVKTKVVEEDKVAKSPKKAPKTPTNTPLQGQGNAKKEKVNSPVKPVAQVAGEGKKKKKKNKSKKNKQTILNGTASPAQNKTEKVDKEGKGNKKALKKQHHATWSSLVASTPAEQSKSKLDSKKVDQAAKAFKKYIEDLPKKSKELFSTPKPVFLQVTLFKIPQVRLNMKIERISLPHPYLNTESDICLLVGDVKRGKTYMEKSEEHYKALLEGKNINFINEIIPLKRFLSEYSQYEQKAKLCDRFDMFIVDGKVSHRFVGNLGKCFLKKRKVPVPVKLTNHDSLPKILKAALTKTAIPLNCAGQVSSAQIGHSQQNAKELSENIVSFTAELSKVIPGGWDNIKSLNIKTDLSDAIPVYFSMKSPNEVSLPEVKKKKTAQPVEGEVTTIPGVTAVVYPSGDVKLKKEADKNDKKKKGAQAQKAEEEDDDEESDMDGLTEFTDDDDDSEVEEDDDDSVVESDQEDNEEVESDDDVSSEEDEIEEAEQEYLKEWQTELASKKVGGKRKAASNEEESSPNSKKGKPNKVAPQQPKQAQGKPKKGPQQPQGQKKGGQNQQKGSPNKPNQQFQKGGKQGGNKGGQQNGKKFFEKSAKNAKPNKAQNAGSPGFNKQKGGSPFGGNKQNMYKGKKGQSPGGKGRK